MDKKAQTVGTPVLSAQKAPMSLAEELPSTSTEVPLPTNETLVQTADPLSPIHKALLPPTIIITPAEPMVSESSDDDEVSFYTIT